VTTTANRPAWYLGSPGRWRDWLNLLHPPYTAWHLSYVVIGASLATTINGEYLVATLLAFALAVGVAAHALDELNGRPLGTSIRAVTLVTVSIASLTAAAAIGVVGITRIGWPLALFVVIGVLLVVGYDLELFGGRLHNDFTFAAAWGAFPVLTAYYAQTQTVRFTAVAAALFAFGLSWTQRVLSTESRWLRRDARLVAGEVVLKDGSVTPLDKASVLRPIDRALRTLSWTVAAIAVALLASHLS
jgi:hypothetical protein